MVSECYGVDSHFLGAKAVSGQGGAEPVMLRFGQTTLILQVGSAGQNSATYELALGSDPLVREYFRHGQLSPVSAEALIQVIEDTIAPLSTQLPAKSFLVSDDAVYRTLAGVLNVVERGGQRVIHREAVENAFEELAMAIEKGRSTALPSAPDFLVALIVLRELMHHLDFERLVVDSSGGC